MDHRRIWARSRDGLVSSLVALGFPGELGDMIAAQLGSPKAIDRMSAYLDHAKPDDIQMIIDEMLAIQSELEAWREKKAGEKANARYNEILNYGLGNNDE